MNKSILIVEDDTWQAEHYARELQRAGYRAQIARHGYDAMAHIEQQTPSAILLDVMLPGTNGVALLHELRSHDDLNTIPVIVSTSLSIPASTLQAYGVRHILDKTKATNHDLVAAINEAVA